MSLKKELQRIINKLTIFVSQLESDNVISQKIAFSVNKKYFYKNNNSPKSKRTYIGKIESDKMQSLMQSSYKYYLLHILHHNVQVLKNALDNLLPFDNKYILGLMSPCVRNQPFKYPFVTTLGKMQTWAKEEYERNPLPFPDRIILAKDGTRVRSKSECIIYNMLLTTGIPFRYDPLLEFTIINAYGQKETITKSPDFQIILPDGSFILIEHAGLLSSHKYVTDLAEKLQIYQLNNYILGYTLFVTSDTIDGGIDSKQINKIIEIISSHYIELQ